MDAMNRLSLNLRAAVVSLLLLVCFLGIWELATDAASVGGSSAGLTAEEIEYQQMMGKNPGAEKTAGVPGPLAVARGGWGHLSGPFYDKGPNDKGIGGQLGHSLARVAAGYLLAMVVAIPLGFLIGMSPLMRKALDPFVQVLKPISPLAWMPLALHALKDPHPILAGMRIGMGIGWLVIVAAEMLVGGTGIVYFVWNEWNNLSLTNVIFAVLVIGVVGMLLDLMFAQLQKAVTYVE